MKKISRKVKIENTFNAVLDHFHPDAMNYGGWTIKVDVREIDLDFMKKEFDGIIEIKDPNDFAPMHAYLSIGTGEFKDAHTIRVLREKVESYKEEADRLYNGIKKLVEGP